LPASRAGSDPSPRDYETLPQDWSQLRFLPPGPRRPGPARVMHASMLPSFRARRIGLVGQEGANGIGEGRCDDHSDSVSSCGIVSAADFRLIVMACRRRGRNPDREDPVSRPNGKADWARSFVEDLEFRLGRRVRALAIGRPNKRGSSVISA